MASSSCELCICPSRTRQRPNASVFSSSTCWNFVSQRCSVDSTRNCMMRPSPCVSLYQLQASAAATGSPTNLFSDIADCSPEHAAARCSFSRRRSLVNQPSSHHQSQEQQEQQQKQEQRQQDDEQANEQNFTRRDAQQVGTRVTFSQGPRACLECNKNRLAQAH
jgi:hypothetical protein